MELLISLIAGAMGGNITGGVLKNINMGVLLNSLAGIAGGGLGSLTLSTIYAGGASTDSGAIISHVVSGGIGGGLILFVIGMIRKIVFK